MERAGIFEECVRFFVFFGFPFSKPFVEVLKACGPGSVQG